MSLDRRTRVGAGLLLLLWGCNGGEVKPDPVSLDSAERLERDGKIPDAIVAYAQMIRELEGRKDYEALLAGARIYHRLFRLRAGEIVKKRPDLLPKLGNIREALESPHGRAFLSHAGEDDIALVTQVSPEKIKAESCARLAEMFLQKGDDDGLCEATVRPVELRRILLWEIAAVYDYLYLLLLPSAPRTRLAKTFQRLAEEYRALSKLPRAKSFATAEWKEVSARYRELSIATEKDPLLPELDRHHAGLRGLTLRQQLSEGTHWADQATMERTSGGDWVQCERSYRRALRHLLVAAEISTTRNPNIQSALRSIPVILQGWSSVVFDR